LKKSITYKIDLPYLLIDGTYVDYYLKKSKFKYKLRKNQILKDCFVSNSGVIIHNLLIPIHSAENLIGFEDMTFYFEHWKKAIEQYIVCKYRKSLKFIKINDEKLYFSVHTPWFGYFSWVTTCLPRIMNLIRQNKDAILLYPEECDNFSFVVESLNMISDLKIKRIPVDHHFFVNNYLLIPCRDWTSSFYMPDLLMVRDYFLSRLNFIEEQSLKYDYLYVSRKKAKRRRVLNEEQIETYLINYGFKIICLEDYTFMEQVSLMKHCKVLISSHGAGLANINFLSEGSLLVELTPKLNNYRRLRIPFWRMSRLLGIEYFSLFCDTNKNITNLYDSDIKVDEIELSKVIEALIDNKFLLI
jgi:hypothetical protein